MQQMAQAPVQQTGRKRGFNWLLPAYAIFESGDSAWSLIVVSLYFNFFVEDVLGKTGAHFGWAVSAGALLIAVLSPALGAAADISGPRKPFMRFFVTMVVALTASLGFIHSYPLALVAFALAYMAANAGFNFFTAMLPANTTADKVHSTISTAVAMGYMGGLACMGLFKVFIPSDRPDKVFLPMAILYLAFSLPCLLFAKDFPKKGGQGLDLRQAYRDVFTTFKAAREHKVLFRFLIGDFLYENAVASVIALMAPYARHVVGFSSDEVFLLFGPALVITVIASFGWGWLVKQIGPKKAILLDMAVWMVMFISALLITNKTLFTFICAPLTGIGLAGVWASSRVLFTALTPVEKSGQFWGLYNLSGRSASVVGDLSWTMVITFVGASAFGYKVALALLMVYVILGTVVILKVPDARPTAANVLAPATT